MAPSSLLLHLPPELLNLIFEWVLSLSITGTYKQYRSLANASLVCSRFRELAQPLLFRDVQIQFDGVYGWGFPDPSRALDRFRQVLADHSTVKNWVKSLDIQGPTMISVLDDQFWLAFQQSTANIKSDIEIILLQLGHLHTLVLGGVTISPTMFRHISNLRELRSVTFAESQLEDDPVEIQLAGPSLRRFVARSLGELPPPHPLNPGFTLLTLGGGVTVMDVDMHILLPHIVEAARLSSWRMVESLTLKVTADDMRGDSLESVLQSFPSVTTLSVIGKYQPASKINISSECIPRIAVVDVPWRFLGGLLPGRPIKAVTVSLGRSGANFDYLQDFRIFERSTVDVEELVLKEVSDIRDLFSAVATWVPNLKRLTVDLCDCHNYLIQLKGLLSAEQMMPNLSHLICNSPEREDPHDWDLLDGPPNPEGPAVAAVPTTNDQRDEEPDQYSPNFNDAVKDWLELSDSVLPSLRWVEFEDRVWQRPSTTEKWTAPDDHD